MRARREAERIPRPALKSSCSVASRHTVEVCSPTANVHDDRVMDPHLHGPSPNCSLGTRETYHQLPVAISLLSRFFFSHMEWSHLWAMAKGSPMVTFSPSHVPIRILLKARPC